MGDFRDFLQGASNSAAANVSAPVDGIAWLLRKAGITIPDAPVGGSDWMAQKGLTAVPQNQNMGLLGEAIGGVTGILGAAKAPQIAKGLLQGADNLAAPRVMNPQTGAVYLPSGKLSSNLEDAEQLAKKIQEMGKKYSPKIEEANGGSVYLTVNKNTLTKSGEVAKNRTPIPLEYKVRFADHPSYWGNTASSDPFTGNTVDDLLRLFEINQGSSPVIGDKLVKARFDPSLGTGVVEKSVYSNATSLRGNPVKKMVAEPNMPFSFIRNNKD